ncbi:MAG: acyl-CoA synthetase [Gammaproteobacteria bacterium]|nr:acyl-CoA synthetase [Gammaproteobacteria bacterium]
MSSSPYDLGLDRNPANHVPLTPLSFLERTAAIFPDRIAVVHGETRRTWAETEVRCRRLASALAARGIGPGDTVAVIAANTPEHLEAHFGIPMCGAVLNAINIRLDAEAIGFILQHAEAKVVICDREFSEVVKRAVGMQSTRPLVVDIDDPAYEGGRLIGSMTYEELLANGDPGYEARRPGDEWEAISLNYTSGTTGNPKGVVYHHRGAYLNALGNVLAWDMRRHPVYLWTLPMFHCNGWCFPWTLAAVAGTSVCLRQVRTDAILDSIRAEGVTHFCGAPIVLNMIANAPAEMKAGIDHQVEVMTAAAPPPASILEKMDAMGFHVTHVYGLTETYGPAVTCEWHEEWDALPPGERAEINSRQGVRYPVLDGLMVADPETLEPVPADGESLGEIFFRGNIVMRGYLKNPSATDAAFSGGWFHSGDLAVMHPDGYLQIKDRTKDIIISGGENISSVEIEGVLYRHPAVIEAAVVARPDEKWGETPCAFVTLRDDATVDAEEIIAFCRDHMAHFKAPKTVIFGPLPKTSTGKVQKFLLREQARELD